MDKLFLFTVKNRERIITAFKLFYIGVIIFTFIGGRSLYYGDAHAEGFFEVGKKFGELAIPLYILTLLPGIARRFGIKHKLISMIMIFRRYLGISMYFCVFAHMWMMRGVDWFLRGLPIFPLATFEIAGIIAHLILLTMVLTSNDWSTKHLGVWWGRIHNLTYTLLWIIFLHVGLQAINTWSILIALAGVLVISSHLYARVKKR